MVKVQNKNCLFAAVFFYIVAGFQLVQGAIYKSFDIGYGSQVAANGLWDLMTNPIKLLTVWVPWQFWCGLSFLAGTYMLWLAFQPVKETT